jgi:hypothetical protein
MYIDDVLSINNPRFATSVFSLNKIVFLIFAGLSSQKKFNIIFSISFKKSSPGEGKILSALVNCGMIKLLMIVSLSYRVKKD